MKKYLISIVVVLTFCFVGPAFISVQAEEGQDVQEILADIKENYASFYDVLQEVKALNLEEYEKLLDGIINGWDELKELERKDPEGFLIQVGVNELEIKTNILEHEYYLAKSETEKGKIKREMRRVLDELFDLKVEERKTEIASLDEEIKKLKAELESVTASKETVVEEKVKGMTQAETDVFDW